MTNNLPVLSCCGIGRLLPRHGSVPRASHSSVAPPRGAVRCGRGPRLVTAAAFAAAGGTVTVVDLPGSPGTEAADQISSSAIHGPRHDPGGHPCDRITRSVLLIRHSYQR